MEAKSIITRPRAASGFERPGFHEISGIAWSGRGKIRRVDVSVDDGKSWQEAQLQEPLLTRALRPLQASVGSGTAGLPLFKAAQIDETGYVQPTLGRASRGSRRKLFLP